MLKRSAKNETSKGVGWQGVHLPIPPARRVGLADCDAVIGRLSAYHLFRVADVFVGDIFFESARHFLMSATSASQT